MPLGRVALALVLWFAPTAALAHQQAISTSELRIDGPRLSGTIRFSLQDLPPFDAAHPEAAAALAASIDVRSSGKRCPLVPGTAARPDGEDGIVIEATWTCPSPIETLSVRAGFLDTMPGGQTHLAKIILPGGLVAQRVARADEPSFEVDAARSVPRAGTRFFSLGVEHIFTGYDHVAFLVALLLLGGTLRELVKIVTAFTVAHSVTLALAAFAIVTPPARLVEALIAASIVYVGLENVWALRRHGEARALAHRWRLTFAFGLVHGFGFAAALRELHLPRALLATGLVGFNLGVEAGQLCIVALLLPLLRKVSFGPRVVRALSLAVSALGVVWLVQRLT